MEFDAEVGGLVRAREGDALVEGAEEGELDGVEIHGGW